MAHNQQYIYVLVDPNTDDIRYVGKSKNPQTRMTDHINGHGRGAKKYMWVDSLVENNQKPLLRILEKCDESEVRERERYWIKYFNNMGFDLTNSVYKGYDKIIRIFRLQYI